ncbi:MAG: hypothetical protein EOO73_25075 [Myxococcales bacterium]|nr:MAG: hypothetical protein EOO73_25075 [Myxococcales bacterium]
MKALRVLRYVALAAGLAYALPTACGSGGIVGGDCREGDCSAAAATSGGGKTGKPTGGSSGTDGGSSPGEAGNGAAAAQGGEGELPDGGFFDSPVDGDPDAMAPLECLPPHDSPSHCGDCDTRCVVPTPLCAPDGNGSFECVPRCVLPLVECQGQCVDPDSFKSDPDNCGACGKECPSEICQDGMCRGAGFGNVALICSDFNSADAVSAWAILLGNAIFLPATNPVHVLAYTRGATTAAVNRVNTVIGWAGEKRGRTVEITEAKTVDSVTQKLNIDDFQVLLIHDLDRASPGDPAAAATTWESSSTLTSFARAGGVVVVLDGGDGVQEMHELINAGNLLDPSGNTSITGQTDMTDGFVWNNAPADVLGVNVFEPFRGTSHTCTFDTNATPSSDLIFVLSDDEENGSGAPVAIHRVIVP